MDWHEIWERKGEPDVAAYSLETLMALDGWDQGAASISEEQFLHIADLVTRELALTPGTRVLEVGCGAGALLWCLRDQGLKLAGIDYSEPLIRHARAAIPEGTFEVAEATRLPFTGDVVVCNSVFQYFPDYDYARRVLDEFQRVSRVALVLDVPDIALREEAQRARAAAGAKPGEHLYYERSFFAGAKVWTNDVPGYVNAPFRFNALLDFRSTRA